MLTQLGWETAQGLFCRGGTRAGWHHPPTQIVSRLFLHSDTQMISSLHWKGTPLREKRHQHTVGAQMSATPPGAERAHPSSAVTSTTGVSPSSRHMGARPRSTTELLPDLLAESLPRENPLPRIQAGIWGGEKAKAQEPAPPVASRPAPSGAGYRGSRRPRPGPGITI